MPDPAPGRAPRPARRRVRTAWAPTWWVASLLAAGLGCASSGWLGGTRATSDAPVDLGFDVWRKDTIHCAEGPCTHRYAIEVDEPGLLRAEVYAPLDPGGPDFALALLDADGEEIARPADPHRRPRRLEHEAAPGAYVLRVSGRGENQGPLRYDVVVFHSAEGPRGSRAATPAPRAVRDSPPAPPPAPAPETAPVRAPDVAPDAATPEALVRGEVLDVESEPGGATFVLLDRGEPHGVRKGMRGQLRAGDRRLAEFVVVEVFRDGSRARIEGELAGEIGIDTVAELYAD
jgi:hypothetical protein